MIRPRIAAILRLALVSALVVPAATCQRFGNARPNMILVLVDTLRVDYLGTYGFKGDVSPNIDKLAAESLRFTHYFSVAPWTKPSVASLFTSLYPQVHGITNHEGKYWGDGAPGTQVGVLPQAAVTLAERLRDRGYRTAAFVANPWLAKRYGFDQGFELYDDHESGHRNNVSELADDVMDWLGRLRPDEPYFLYLHVMDVHAPYSANRQDFNALRQSPSVATGRHLAKMELPEARYTNLEVTADWASDAQRHELAYWRTRYASGIRGFDRRFGALLDDLRRGGYIDRSYVMLTADHGEELYDHGDWSHGHNLYDHQTHVPFLVRKPGASGKGKTVDATVESVDLMPTLLEIAGAEPVPEIQGRDVSGLISGWSGSGREAAFSTGTQRFPGLYSWRTESHRLVFNADNGEAKLFDLNGDPTEHNDMSMARPELVQEMRDHLMARIQESITHGSLRRETTDMTPEQQKRLRALGYLK
jgi:arylsulfatase A-like enzyme